MKEKAVLRFSMRLAYLGLIVCIGLLLVSGLFWLLRQNLTPVQAAPIDPPEGYPKLLLSTKTVSPTLAGSGGAKLTYYIDILNTGAYTAYNTSLVDAVPLSTTYNNDAWASSGTPPTFDGTTVQWVGDVGFDATVRITFSVRVTDTYLGLITNTAVISNAMLAQPLTLTAKTTITDDPIFTIHKSSAPEKPGANKELTYLLTVENWGQPVTNLPISVTDQAPLSTTVSSVGPDGSESGGLVTWLRNVSLGFGESSEFTFTVLVGDVPSGTVITNQDYRVYNAETGITAGEPMTVTIIDPILLLAKTTDPDPPGSNRELTYILTLLNTGSLATNLVITDRIPNSVTYVSGGTLLPGGIVQWTYPQLDTGESAEFLFTVYVGDIAYLDLTNANYRACSAEGVCVDGVPLSSTVDGPTFEAFVYLDPIAKKPGGGGGPVTPTLVLRNLGPGNAIDAHVKLLFQRISVSANDLYAIPPVGTPPPFPPGPDCGEQCVSYLWTGNLDIGQVVTFTTIEGQSTIVGEEGSHYTATLVVSDTLGITNTEIITASAIGTITHNANLIPIKIAPEIIARGELMTYTINVWNSGLSTDEPPYPWLTDTLPLSVTLISISDGGMTSTVGGRTVISWTLPAMSTGQNLYRYFTVQVNDDLVSGTHIVNDDYRVSWFDLGPPTGIYSNTGEPITTTVLEVGLIDSFKVVTPTLLQPGEGNKLTYYLHIVNSGPLDITGVKLYDTLPWQNTTYQRDAVASAGSVVSDIVSLQWEGDVGSFSSQIVTFTVMVDPYFEGVITNTAVITHPSLLSPVVIEAVAYVTNMPVLQITKTASPGGVRPGENLRYTLVIANTGQQATSLVVTDTLPVGTSYVGGSAGIAYADGQVRWDIPVLKPGESLTVYFDVKVEAFDLYWIINRYYRVSCAEGAADAGPPVYTKVIFYLIYLTLIQH